MNPHLKHFEAERDLMNGIAYRMLGSISDAEDVVQDAYFRWTDIDLKGVDSPRAYLATTVSRLCIDRLRRRKIEKLNYVGPWLPEPLIELEANPLQDSIEKAEHVSMAFLHVLETLAPLERAVFILNEAVDLSHDEIAETLGIKSAHSRQLLRRARSKIDQSDALRSSASSAGTKGMLVELERALRAGDVDTLKELLAEDVIALTDGGGVVSAALIPLRGFERVSTVLGHVMKNQPDSVRFESAVVGCEPGILIFDGDEVQSVISVRFRDGKISSIYIVRNPRKIRLSRNQNRES